MIQKSGKFYNLSFFISSNLWFEKVLLVVFVDNLPLGFESVNPLNPHIFVDPDLDPESQNLADSTDPD